VVQKQFISNVDLVNEDVESGKKSGDFTGGTTNGEAVRFSDGKA
jgi:hypothetical protein